MLPQPCSFGQTTKSAEQIWLSPIRKTRTFAFLRYPGEKIYIFATDMWPGAIHVSLRQYIKLQVKIPVNTDKKDILSFVFDELRGGFFFFV